MTSAAVRANGEPLCCPRCSNKSLLHEDKYCRQCGMVLYLECSGCRSALRFNDNFCPKCGKRRWYYFEGVRNFVTSYRGTKILGITGAVVGFGALYLILRDKLK